MGVRMSIKAVIFDMDGTILHTLPDLAAVTNLTMEQMGFPTHSEHDVMTFVGNGAARLVSRACPPEATDVQRERALALWQELYLVHGDKLTQPFPGIPELVAELRRRGVKTAVLSNKFDAAVRVLADDFFPGLFDVARGEIPPTPRKPDPAALLQIMGEFGVTPAETLYVGDTDVDAQVAVNAGVRFVGVAWGYEEAIPMDRAKLSAYIAEPRELLACLDWE